MEHVITITPSQILAFCSAIVVIAGATTVIVNLIAKAAAPNKTQNARLDLMRF